MRRPRARLFNRAAVARAVAVFSAVTAIVVATVYLAAHQAQPGAARVASLPRPRS